MSQQAKLKTPGLCRFYTSTGSCRFGESCKFRHEGAPTLQPSNLKGGPPSIAHVSSTGGSSTTLPTQEASLSGKNSSTSTSQRPCFAWNRNGRCSKGNACKYRHDPKVNTAGVAAQQRESVAKDLVESLGLQQPEATKQDNAVVQQDVVHDFIIMTSTSGLAIQNLLTGFESCRIRVEQLPLDASDSEIKTLFVERGLDTSQVFISGSTKTSEDSQHVDVICHQDAQSAMPILKSSNFRGHRISFSIVGGNQLGSSMTPDRNVLTLTWSSPSFSCIATLPTHSRARETVRDLNGKTCNGCNVSIGFFPSSDSATTPSVIIHGLHPDTTDTTIKTFLRLGYWSLIERQPIRRDDSPHNVRTSFLRQFPLLSRIDDATMDHRGGQHSLKLYFPSWKEAKAAHDFFEQPKEFSDYPHFTLHLPARWKYTACIPFPQYNAQRRQWQTIQNSATLDASLKVSQSRPTCTLTVDGKDPKAAGALKVQVERLLVGEKLDVWHPFFISPASRHIFVEVGKGTNTFIKVDRKARLLKGFGATERIQRAVQLLQTVVTKLEEQERVVHLKSQSIRYFVRQGLARMQQELGEENVTLNVASRPATITIRGGEAARVLVDRLIKESLDKSSSLEPLNSPETCPVCQDNAGHAVKLDCQHVYCEACFKHYLSTAADNQKFPLICLGNEGTCDYPIPLPTIRKFLVPQVFKALLEAALDAYIATRPQDFKFCPTPDCRQVYRTMVTVQGQVVVCPSCFAEICSSCHKEGHDGITCEEKRLASDTSAQERATEEFAHQAGFKKCPSCQVWVEKTEGCNHMTCGQCRAHFCWVCLQCFDSAVIYNHMNEVHGGLYTEQIRDGGANRLPGRIPARLREDNPFRNVPMHRPAPAFNHVNAALPLQNEWRTEAVETPQYYHRVPRWQPPPRRPEPPVVRQPEPERQGWGCIIF